MGADGFTFICQDDFKKLFKSSNYTAYLGHNRLATLGACTTAYAHPFRTNNGIYFMHNGVIRNAVQLAKEHKIKYKVDSEVAMHLIASLGVDAAAKELMGAFAFVWYNENDKTINFLRNAERPLWLGVSEYKNKIIYGSEVGLLKWLVERNNIVSKFEYKEIPVGTLMTVPLFKGNDLSITEKKVELHSYKSNNTWTNYCGPAMNSDDAAWAALGRAPFGDGKNEQTTKRDRQDKALKALGLQMRGSVEFTLHDFRPYRKQKGLGTGIGCMSDDPWMVVEVHGLHEDQAKAWINECQDTSKYLILRGFIYGMYRIQGTEDYCLQVHNPQESQYYVPPEAQKQTIIHLPKKDIQLPDDLSEKEEPLKIKAGDRMMTTKEFLRRASYGCADCGGNISLQDAEEVVWTVSDTVMCPRCVADWDQKYQNHGVMH
jgi:hypothetical protein